MKAENATLETGAGLRIGIPPHHLSTGMEFVNP
jgi:hypothetical protein